MRIGRRRVRAIVRKELREFRRNRSLIAAMTIVPAVFSIQPLVNIFALDSSASATLRHEHVLLYLLGIPVLVPSLVAAYSVAAERQQGTLEPILAAPIRREELLLGKALATLLPSIAVAYAVYALFLAVLAIFAVPSVTVALLRSSDLLAQLCFTPLLAGWSIWTALVISTRSSDVRVAQPLAALAGLPSIVLTTLIALNVIPATLVIALVAAVGLVALNGIGWWVASAAFDRERLITGT